MGARTISEVESNPLHSFRAGGVYNRSPEANILQHTTVAKDAIHFWSTRLTQ